MLADSEEVECRGFSMAFANTRRMNIDWQGRGSGDKNNHATASVKQEGIESVCARG